MRPYRKVDMGKELEDHGDRLKKLEELRAQVRVFQTIAGMLLIFVVGTVWKDCQAQTQERIDQQVIANDLKLHKEKPHNVHETTLEAMQQTIEEHDARITACEKRVRIKR
jgi:hypothetical protein